MFENRLNWAGNYTYHAESLHFPQTVEQVQELIRRSSKIKVLGSRHSFNGIADSPGDLISLERLDRVFLLDRQRMTVTVDSGVRYGQLCRELHRQGYALHNMASLPHISVAGACATATHGSGDHNGSLSTAVKALEMVTADGEVATLSRDTDADLFLGAVVALGGLGVITKLTLYIEPAFQMRQVVYENLSFARLEEHFEDIFSGAYSVSLFTYWQNPMIDQVWLKSRVEVGATWEAAPHMYGATLAPAHRHPIPTEPPVNCTPQMGIPGPWHERLPHFRMAFTPSSGQELQSEYLVPRHHALEAVHAIYGLRDYIAPLVQISEIRTIAADNLWMSPFYGQDCVGIHFTWHKNWPTVKRVLPLVEKQLAPLKARPHWSKLFTMSPSIVQSHYEKLPNFRQLLQAYDPQGKFRNAFLDGYVFELY